MRLAKITNIRQFMNKLLLDNAFDSFLISEAIIKTGNSFVIDGHLNKEFYSSAEIDDMESEAQNEGRIFSNTLSRWSAIKPFALSLMKGKKTPVYFKMSFYLAEENIIKLLSSLDTSITANDIDGLSLIVKYSEEELTIVSSASLKIFSLDKSLEKYWDDMVIKFLSSHSIEYGIM